MQVPPKVAAFWDRFQSEVGSVDPSRLYEVFCFGDSEEFAAVEGEGDGSLAYWREGHTQYFNRMCSRMGRTFVPDMPVACERFRVIHQEAT